MKFLGIRVIEVRLRWTGVSGRVNDPGPLTSRVTKPIGCYITAFGPSLPGLLRAVRGGCDPVGVDRSALPQETRGPPYFKSASRAGTW